MTDLQSLISKLESATGPSRELDAEISLAIGMGTEILKRPGFLLDRAGRFVMEIESLRYTASLDAALTLLGSNWEWAIDHYPDETAFAKRYRVEISGAPVHSVSLPICICIASLRARHAETQKEQGS